MTDILFVVLYGFLFCPQCLKTQDCQDELHTSFAQLLSELNKSDAPYALSVANRLYGEQSYQFVEVCVFFFIMCSWSFSSGSGCL